MENYNFDDQMEQMNCSDGSIRRTGGIGDENKIGNPVMVFLGMEFGRYDGREWGYIFGNNPDGSVAILIPMNADHSDQEDVDPHIYSEIYTHCEWNDRFNAYYAGGDCVHIENGEITWVNRRNEA